jgi:hypothetical protein
MPSRICPDTDETALGSTSGSSLREGNAWPKADRSTQRDSAAKRLIAYSIVNPNRGRPFEVPLSATLLPAKRPWLMMRFRRQVL